MNLSKHGEAVKDKGAWCAAAHGPQDSNWTATKTNNLKTKNKQERLIY